MAKKCFNIIKKKNYDNIYKYNIWWVCRWRMHGNTTKISYSISTNVFKNAFIFFEVSNFKKTNYNVQKLRKITYNMKNIVKIWKLNVKKRNKKHFL